MHQRAIVALFALLACVVSLLVQPRVAGAQALPAVPPPAADSAEKAAQASPAVAPAAPTAGAADKAAQVSPTAAPATPTLDVAEPPPGAKDWVQLNNGEWMMGEFLAVRDGTLEFDSDEFKLHSMDFADIKRLFLRTPVEVGLTNLEKLRGPAVVTRERIVVQTAEGEREAPRSQIMSIVPTADWELGYWSLDAAIGLSLARGNSDQGTLSVSNIIKREDSFMRLTLDYLGNYGESKGDKNTHNHRGLVNLDLFVSPRFFITPVMATFEYDEFRNVKLRATPGAGAGVHLIQHAKVEWDMMGAGAYQYVRFLSVLAGEDASASNAAVVLRTTLDADPTEDLELHLEYTNMLVVTDLGLTSHHVVGQIEVDLTSIFELDVKVIFDRTEQPVTESDGKTPKKNDIQLVASLGIELG